MKKIIVLLMFSIFVLFGCGGGDDQSSTGTTEVEVWTWWQSETRGVPFQSIADSFNESQDQYHVTVTAIPFSDYNTKLTAAIGAGTPPDVAMMDTASVQYNASMNQLTPITDYVENDSEVNPDEFYTFSKEAVQYNGEVYAMPFNTDVTVLYYNKDMFEEKGITPSTFEDPWTWEEFQNAAYTCEESDGAGGWNTVGFAFEFGSGAKDAFLVSANNGEPPYFDKETQTFHVNSEENIAFFNFWMEFQDHYGLDNIQAKQADYSTDLKDPLASGEVCMITNNATYSSELNDNSPELNYGVMPIPVYEEGNDPYTRMAGYSATIPTGSDNVEGAYAFLSYLVQEEAQLTWVTETADLPAINTLEDNEEIASNEVLVTAMQVAEFGVDPYSATPEFFEYPQYLSPIIDQITLGEKTPEEGLNEAQDVLNEQYNLQ